MNKEYLKSYIYNCQTKIASIITEGVVNRNSKAVILRLVKKEIFKLNILNDVEKNELWLWSVSFYRKCIAGAGRSTDTEVRSDKIYAVLKFQEKKITEIKNDVANNVEARKKRDSFVDELKSGYKFFYCTVLPDPADDHRDYQGLYYYKGNAEYSEEEKRFISNSGMLSVEEVCLNAPWLTIRRNCRHRFIGVLFEEIGKFSEFDDVKNDVSYEEGQYMFYKSRLKLLKGLKIKTPDLEKDMVRTEKLVRKWNRARILKKKRI